VQADNGGPPKEFKNPPLRGRHVYLRPVNPEDYGYMRALDLGEELGVRWRFRGATPSPEQWAQAGGAQLAQFMVTRSSDNRPLGAAAVYQHNFQDEHAYLAVAAFDTDRNPLMVLGTALFVEYVFTCWNFRKLYLDLPEYNLPQLASGVGTLFAEEGRLREHMYYDGRFWDKLVLALYRRTWEERSGRLLAAALPAKRRSASLRLPPRQP
jgi:hypothetical protein